MWQMWYSTPVLPEMPSLWVRVLQLWAKEPFSKVCWSRSLSMQHRKVYSVTHNESDHSDNFFIGMIQCTTTNTPDWKVSILINHQRISFKTDTGAQCNVISKSRYHQLGSMPLQNQIQDWLHLVGNAWIHVAKLPWNASTLRCQLWSYWPRCSNHFQTCVNNVWMLSTTMTLIFWNWTVTRLKDWVA